MTRMRPSPDPESDGARPITVLVTAASRHGATAELASAIAVVLKAAGLHVDVRTPAEVDSVADYDALVVGSGVYRGGWLPGARQLLKRFERELTGRPVWLFSSGPLEDWPARRKQPVLGLPPAVGAAVVDHHVFGGRLNRRRLGVAERLSVGLLRAPHGDFRPWDDVIDWARHIGGCLTKDGHRAPPPDRIGTRWPLGTGDST